VDTYFVHHGSRATQPGIMGPVKSYIVLTPYPHRRMMAWSMLAALVLQLAAASLWSSEPSLHC
jgi:hypothetical protein